MNDSLQYFTAIANEKKVQVDSEAFARLMDEKDELRNIRQRFEYPKMKQLVLVDLEKVDPEEDSVYLCGNSLGLMPRGVRDTVGQVMQKWSDLAVYGHHHGEHPWYICDEELIESMSRIVGASTDEVAIMNQLTSNLHFLLLSFYRPTESRFKILFEDRAFPSDHYAYESQARLHGLDPANVLIPLKPRPGEYCLRTEDIEATLAAEGASISLVCFSGVQYYTGQNFDMARITRSGHEAGAMVGWDLAHSVGNVELALHDWDVDFAVWTTYKYLNTGAGGTGGAFVHARLLAELSAAGTPGVEQRPVLTGWWGHDIESRMHMTNAMTPGVGIRRFRMSTPSAMHCAVLRASLNVFDEAGGMKPVRAKSVLLTAYLELLLLGRSNMAQSNRPGRPPLVQIITPTDSTARGNQLSILCVGADVDLVNRVLQQHGVVCDIRRPHVIRVAACPLYNSFWDVFRGAKTICDALLAAEA